MNEKMVEESSEKKSASAKIALRLYDNHIRERFNRNKLEPYKDQADLERIGNKNYITQLLEPRRKFVQQLKEAGDKVTTADKVALLWIEQLPTLEISALIHKLSVQALHDPNAIYFSKLNQADNCGCGGCNQGSGCGKNMSFEDKYQLVTRAKPYSIDPFNEVGLTDVERDSLKIKDLLGSYEKISDGVAKINRRYFDLHREVE
jgi:hypothetical protein